MKLIRISLRCLLSTSMMWLIANGQEKSLSDDMTIPAGSMTLEQAFEIALKENPGLDEVEKRIEGAEATIQRARSYLFPTIGVTAGYTLGNVTMQPDWAPSMRVTEDFNQINAGVSFRWRLFDGLQDIHYLRAAKKGLQGMREQHVEVQRILLEQVSSAMIQSQLALESMKIAKSAFEFNEKLEQDAQQRFEVGEMPEANVLNFSLALIQAETDFENAKRNYEIACTIIAQLLSYSSAKLPEGQLPAVDLSEIESVTVDFETAFSNAMQHRPDIRALQAAIDASGHQVDALKGTYMPRLELVAGYGYTKMNDVGTIDQDENDASVGLQASWNIFSGGRRKAQILEMRSQKNQSEAQYAQLMDSIASQIRQTLIDLETSIVLVDKSVKAELYARKIRDFVEKSYRAGSASITRLNEAQNNWVRASSGLSAAKLQMKQNLYALRAATGEILLPLQDG